MITTTVSSRGQIVLPASIRELDQIRSGQTFEIERLEAGEYRLIRRSEAPNEGMLDWLLACPEKDWFEPVRSELTDSIGSAL